MAMKKRIILKHDKTKHFFDFKALYTRKDTVNNWEIFFDAVKKEFEEKFGKLQHDTIEEYQNEVVNDIIMWLAHLMANKEFTRGDARAIEELLNSLTWYGIAAEEKYIDRIPRNKTHYLALYKWLAKNKGDETYLDAVIRAPKKLKGTKIINQKHADNYKKFWNRHLKNKSGH